MRFGRHIGTRPATIRPSISAISLALFLATTGAFGPAIAVSKDAAKEPVDVVFICQYGYAKSLVAAKHFEAIAAEKGLNVRVIARGITPKDTMPAPMANNLGKDGFDVKTYKPVALSAKDTDAAEYIVTFGVDVAGADKAQRLDWTEVSALSENYDKARNEIRDRLQVLATTIAAKN